MDTKSPTEDTETTQKIETSQNTQGKDEKTL